MGWGKQREGGAPSLSELDEERKTKRSYEKAVREGNGSREILLGEPPRDPVSWRAGHRDPRESAFRISAGGGAGPGAPALSTHRPHSSLQSPRGASPSLPGSPILEPGPEWKPGVGVGEGCLCTRQTLGPAGEPRPSPELSHPLLVVRPTWATLPLPPFPIEFLASGSWRQLERPTNFSPGHFLTPSTPQCFLFFSLLSF